MANITPIGDRLVVEMLDSQTETASGILVPDSSKEKPQTGKVVAVGKGAFDAHTGKHIEMEVKVGDTVLFSEYGPSKIKYEGKEIYILRESDVYAIVN